MDTTRKPRRQLAGSLWFVLGLIVAAALVPAATVAAVSTFRLQGNSGTLAEVTKNAQLLTVESAPSAYYRSGYFGFDGTCHIIATAPATKGLVIEQLSFVVQTDGAFDSSHVIVVTVSSDCGGSYVEILQPDHLGTYTIPMVPGLPIPAGGHLSARSLAGVVGEVSVSGYKVPATDVP